MSLCFLLENYLFYFNFTVTSKKIGRPMPICQTMDIHCAGFTFVSNFDSGNLARVEEVSRNSVGKC